MQFSLDQWTGATCTHVSKRTENHGDAIVHAGDECVDVGTAPLGSAGEARPVGGEGRTVAERRTRPGIGIEVVVDVDAVDVVTACDVEHDGNGLGANFRDAWVHPFVDSISHGSSWKFFEDVVGGRGMFVASEGAVRIKPSVKFDAPFVGFFDSEL